MSTLVVVGVVLLAVAGVLHLALDQPDQPATARRREGRGKRAATPRRMPRDPRRVPPVPRRVPSVPRRVVVDDMVLAPVAVDVATAPATRLRSAVTLMMLVAVLGASLALLVAAVVVGAARVVTGGLA